MALVDQFLYSPDDLLWTVVTASIVSALISYILKKREMRSSAELEFEFEERKFEQPQENSTEASCIMLQSLAADFGTHIETTDGSP